MYSVYTVEQVAQAIADNAKTGKWLSCHFQVKTEKGVIPIGVKAFGKWVQRIEVFGIVGSVEEKRTLRDLKAETIIMLECLIASV